MHDLLKLIRYYFLIGWFTFLPTRARTIRKTLAKILRKIGFQSLQEKKEKNQTLQWNVCTFPLGQEISPYNMPHADAIISRFTFWPIDLKPCTCRSYNSLNYYATSQISHSHFHLRGELDSKLGWTSISYGGDMCPEEHVCLVFVWSLNFNCAWIEEYIFESMDLI